MVITIPINAKNKSAFEQELLESIKEINKYKLACEANITAILYKKPDLIYEINLSLSEFSNNIWKVYWTIAHEIIKVENKALLDDMTVGFYLEKHPKLKEKYNEYGGYDTVIKAGEYVQIENLDGYIQELRKWNCVIGIAKKGFAVKDRLKDYCDMTSDEIYAEYEAFLNDVFANVDVDLKSYNVFEDVRSYVDELDKGINVGMPLYNAPLLTKEIGGLNLNGQIYGLGANSGTGKSTMAINYIVPSAIKYNERAVFIINEEDETKIKREMLIWVANNVFKEELHKYVLRDGKFDEQTKELLYKCADWIEEKKEKHIITVIPLEQYSVKKVIKIIKKYSSAFGVKLFVLDTLKESMDSLTDEIYKSMMRDMVALYDVVKPAAKNVGLFVTYQLGKNSLKIRHFTNNDIGLAKSIVDVMSVNLMMRRPFEDELQGGKNELICYKLEGKNQKSKIPFKMNRDKNYMITFIPKNRFGNTDAYQIVSECDLSTNIYKDVGICYVPQDW